MTGAPRVLVAVSGSISAAPAAEIVRLLMKGGARVDVAMTPSAQRFITPLTFGAITQRPVFVDLFDEGSGAIEHVERAHDVDLMLIAPASANVLARLAHGLADDIVTATALSTKAPIWVAPAMETGMWENAATQDNLRLLVSRGVRVIPPEAGPLASGRSGVGRLAAPEHIAELILSALRARARRDLLGRRVVITAGPTHEPLDPVRVLTNRSTGEMGIALADAASRRGAEVTLILGPTHLSPPHGVRVVRIETAREMLAAAEAAAPVTDVFIGAAAVSDFRPAEEAADKLKRSDPRAIALGLVENPDVLATVSPKIRPRGRVIGFAAETEAVEDNGRKKMEKKGCDLLIANRVGKDRGFGPGLTEVIALRPGGPPVAFGPAKKDVVAGFILDQIASLDPPPTTGGEGGS